MHSVRPFVFVLAVLGAVMLVATLFYPFGYDQAVFGVGGEMVLKGAVPYRDFLDTKQPLIFYLYAIAMGVFGRHEWSIHLLDIFYQLLAAYYFFRILRRELSYEIALLSSSLMLILYAGSGFWMTCEAESFAILPSLLLVDVTVRTVTSKRLAKDRFAFQYGLLAGVAAIVLLLLKFTLVLGGLAAMVFVLSRPGINRKIKWRYSIAPTASSLALALVCVIALWWAGCVASFSAIARLAVALQRNRERGIDPRAMLPCVSGTINLFFLHCTVCARRVWDRLLSKEKKSHSEERAAHAAAAHGNFSAFGRSC